MRKKLLSLALALALCLSLSAPALASGIPYIVDDTGEMWALDEEPKGSGHGWTWVDHYLSGTGTGSTLTLNGFNGEDIWSNTDTNIVLTAGSKNTATSFTVCYADVKFSGSGELVFVGKPGSSPFWCGEDASVTFNDGLTMTGGASASDNLPLTLNKDGHPATAGGKVAEYVRIAPEDSAAATPAPSSTGFTDVAANSPYAEAVQWAVDQGITKGTSATTFGPNQTCSTGQILTFLWRAAGSPSVSGPFTTDVQKAMAWGVQKLKIGEGVRPEFECTRVAAVNYIWHYFGDPKPNKTVSFTDVTSSTIGRTAISWAVEQGITNGTSATTFSPYDTCTRGQIVTFLYRASK